MKSTGLLCGLLVAICTLAGSSALGQGSLPPPTLPPQGAAPSGTVIGPAPTATFNGTIQSPLPPATWDPYATPGSMPVPLMPEDPDFMFATPMVPGPVIAPTFSVATAQRFLDEMRLDFVSIAGSGPDQLGVNDLELSARFAIPVLHNIQTPLLITPGFAVHWFNGPEGAGFDLPPRVYDAYLEGAWNPRVTQWFSGELALRVGVYSDFEKVTGDSVRFLSKGLAVMHFTPSFKVKAGVWYLDRNKVKILPAGGVVWTPNPNVRWEILFPNPKIAWRLSNFGSVEWWAYVRGEYGGGAWTVRRAFGGGFVNDSIDYNDLRVTLGLEFIRPGGMTGLFEVGVAFEREILYQAPTAMTFRPDPNFLLRFGLAY